MNSGPYRTDLSKTLEQLTGHDVGNPENAPTEMVETILRAWKKSLGMLNDQEIWLLVSQQDGLPFVLDVVWPMLERDPLYCFEHYEGDVLASLLRAPEHVFGARPEYAVSLDGLKQRALAAPEYINDMFREVLTGSNL